MPSKRKRTRNKKHKKNKHDGTLRVKYMQHGGYVADAEVDTALQGMLTAAYQFGYRISILVGASLSLLIADAYSWPIAYQLMALIIAACSITILLSILLVKGNINF